MHIWYLHCFRSPTVCGITTLGMDHTSRLGDSIGEIAWHKGGIMKVSLPWCVFRDVYLCVCVCACMCVCVCVYIAILCFTVLG